MSRWWQLSGEYDYNATNQSQPQQKERASWDWIHFPEDHYLRNSRERTSTIPLRGGCEAARHKPDDLDRQESLRGILSFCGTVRHWHRQVGLVVQISSLTLDLKFHVLLHAQ